MKIGNRFFCSYDEKLPILLKIGKKSVNIGNRFVNLSMNNQTYNWYWRFSYILKKILKRILKIFFKNHQAMQKIAKKLRRFK